MRFEVRFGQAELTNPDPERPNGWLLSVGGVSQSFVDLDDPVHLRFEYMRHVGFVLESLSPGTLEILHIGAGAFTAARYLAHTRPGSRQLAFEIDDELVEAIRGPLRIAEIPDLQIETCDGRIGLSRRASGSCDVVLLDAWVGAVMPPRLSTAEFFSEVARVLRPEGCLVANLAGGPELEFARRVAATAREAFPHVLLLADSAVLTGLVFGHFVLAASPSPEAITSIADRVRRQGPTRVSFVHGEELEMFRGQTSPFRD